MDEVEKDLNTDEVKKDLLRFKGKRYDKYTEEEKKELFLELCTAVVDNNTSFKKELEVRGVNYTTFNSILINNKEFCEIYNIARFARCDYLFEEVIEIADTPFTGEEEVEEIDSDGNIQKVIKKKGDLWRHRQMQIDARKWAVQRINPLKFGEKVDITSQNKAINQVVMFEIPNDGRNEPEKD